jgi:hypothetical protein
MLGTDLLFAPRQRDVDTVAAVHGGTPVSELPLEQPRHDRVALGADARAVVDEEFRSRFTLARKFHTLLAGGATECSGNCHAVEGRRDFRAYVKTAWRFCFSPHELKATAKTPMHRASGRREDQSECEKCGLGREGMGCKADEHSYSPACIGGSEAAHGGEKFSERARSNAGLDHHFLHPADWSVEAARLGAVRRVEEGEAA